MCYKRNIEVHSSNYCCRGKATHSECVSVVLITQHAKRMCHITFPSVACSALPCFFPHHFKKRLNFRKNLLKIKYVF
jgi:hypothetical protein